MGFDIVIAAQNIKYSIREDNELGIKLIDLIQ